MRTVTLFAEFTVHHHEGHNSYLGKHALTGTRLPRMPNCLTKLTTVLLSHRLKALFIFITSFVFFASVRFYWRTEEDAEGQLYSLPTQSRFGQFLSSLPCPTASGPPLSPGDVFFVETSERTSPSYLFTCSVESAARRHPGTRVVVLMKGLANGNASLPNHWGFSLLSCFPNVEIRPLDLTELFSGTPLAEWYLQAQQRQEPYFLPVLSDACRITIMWKFGGIYLDTDFIVLKNLKNLTNALGMQSQDVLNGAFLSFKPKHEFIELCMKDFVENYNGWVWGHQGPQLLTRVFKKWCSISRIQKSMSCRGVNALATEAFYPIRWEDWKKLFEEISSLELHRLLNNTYAVHVWNKLSHGTRLEITSQAFLAQLYSQFCPATYDIMKKASEEQSKPAA
ncbi:lactosylceramide 4-alpha-galactosyltransferase-like isoform X1 [Falco rusticolus]|uniref:lactosylceramide 4-alpha-galactosyltransferase-like isoform X1 n=2 Tax=Falco rusticolus TaxID=120794 RepID=UPI001886A7E6|nr:lactosylceramide 4-alpha-galactosyltransferase-like isoform X1 [Falco rusticolus]XP_037244781.1 lactosylceramide 4-alpha-galactosyltransferase-like isoform X1 [Falco rusticolus]XP_037244782.1 lactosylceramide 4-alpha-galactosyltransferase-like isoform X1 [Falco rusticolus]XP_037244783.1 lactosylceramide 4-alpha-galactosyltransferase-like isoform X1 [Falco rusticolus]XP_037244784.1 lactosylceramide 4-alpha-galactosyltransferase-like isoform X1 [Falco rusticolus]